MGKYVNKKSLLVALLVLVSVFMLVGSKKVLALSDWLPEWWPPNFVRTIPANESGDPHLLLSSYGWDNSLDSPDGYVKLFFDQQNGNSVRIYNAGYCGAPPDGTTSNNNSIFGVYNTDANENTDFASPPWPGGRLVSQWIALPGDYCGASYMELPIYDGAMTQSTVQGHQGKYVAYLKGSIIKTWCGTIVNGECQGAVNAFKVQAVGAGAKASYYALNSDALNPALPSYNTPGVIAVQDRADAPSGVKNTYYNIAFEFAPTCVLQGSKTGYLKWGNLEQGTGLQLSKAWFDIVTIDRATGKEKKRQTYTPPDDANPYSVQSFPFTVDAQYKYRWEWQGLQRDNALQVWMPYDSAEFNFTCGQMPEGNVEAHDCDVFSGWAVDPDNMTANVIIQIFLDGKVIHSQPTDILRGDVNAAMQTKYGASSGGALHGFSKDMNPYKDAYMHSVDVYALDTQDQSKSTLLGTFQIGSGAGGCTLPDCSLYSSTPAIPQPNDPFSATVGFTYSPGGVARALKWDMGLNINGSRQNPPVTQGYSTQGFYNYDGGPIPAGANRTDQITINNIVVGNAGPYTVTWQTQWILPNDSNLGTLINRMQANHAAGGKYDAYNPAPNVWYGTMLCPNNGNPSPNIGYIPYLKIYGNDVAAGGEFDVAGSAAGCKQAGVTPPNPTAALWAFTTKVGNNYGGASGQFGTVSLGTNDQLFSAGARNGLAAPNPNIGLSFGNMVANLAQVPSLVNDYGGHSGMHRCIPDYYSAKPASSAVTGNQSVVVAIGPYPVTGGLPLTVPDDHQTVVFVTGDAYIDSDIIFASRNTGWSDPIHIPSFYLVVKGNIYIKNTVTQLDGVYIAQPSAAPNSGKIYTCSPGGGGLYDSNNLYNSCTSPLVVTGAFMANQIKYQRTNGTLNKSLNSGANEGPGSGNIAEIFNFSQELYLAPQPPVFDVLHGGAAAKPYDSITSLPPIL